MAAAKGKPRPGTKLDHRFTVKIMQPRAGRDVFCGTLDTRQRIYQRGVSLTTQVYWKLRLVSFGLSEWAQISGGKCERIEFTDLKSGKCWAADYDRAAMTARQFTGENGSPRIGVPLEVFDVDDALSLGTRTETRPCLEDHSFPDADCPECVKAGKAIVGQETLF